MPTFPVKPTSGGRPLSSFYHQLARDPKWVQEAKLDGVRGWWDGEELWSRTGNRLPRVERVKALLPRGVPLDGEIVHGAAGPVYWLFDLPSMADAPYTERRAALEALHAGRAHAFGNIVRLAPYVTWDDVERLDLEGVVFKRTASRYRTAHRPGVKTPDWVKFVARML
jgi:ATP-dependent DNA ligase